MILSYTTVGFVQGLDHDVYDTIVLYNSDSSHREVKLSLEEKQGNKSAIHIPDPPHSTPRQKPPQ